MWSSQNARLTLAISLERDVTSPDPRRVGCARRPYTSAAAEHELEAGKQGSRPGTSYFCMPRRVLLALDPGYTPPLHSPPTMTNVKTAYPSSRKRNRKFYRHFFLDICEDISLQIHSDHLHRVHLLLCSWNSSFSRPFERLRALSTRILLYSRPPPLQAVLMCVY